ncbi:MAG: hypothetical protein V3U78_05425 [Thiotrichaceae bacterium]
MSEEKREMNDVGICAEGWEPMQDKEYKEGSLVGLLCRTVNEIIIVKSYFDGGYMCQDNEAHTAKYVKPLSVNEIEHYLKKAKELS